MHTEMDLLQTFLILRLLFFLKKKLRLNVLFMLKWADFIFQYEKVSHRSAYFKIHLHMHTALLFVVMRGSIKKRLIKKKKVADCLRISASECIRALRTWRESLHLSVNMKNSF